MIATLPLGESLVLWALLAVIGLSFVFAAAFFHRDERRYSAQIPSGLPVGSAAAHLPRESQGGAPQSPVGAPPENERNQP